MKYFFFVVFMLSEVISFSQNFLRETDTFVFEEDTLIGIGQLIEGHKVGFWNYNYQDGKFACRAFFLIDTSLIKLNQESLNELNIILNSVDLDSLIVSYELSEIKIKNSTLSIAVSSFIPVIYFDKNGIIKSEIKENSGKFCVVEYQESNKISSFYEIKNGKSNGFHFIYDENNRLIYQKFIKDDVNLFSFRYEYKDNTIQVFLEEDSYNYSETENTILLDTDLRLICRKR